LTREERQTLRRFVSSEKRPAQLFTRARILLKADQGEEGPGWSDVEISQALDITVQTVERVRRQLVEGFDAVLKRQKYTQKVSRKKLDEDGQAHLVALSCSSPPQVIYLINPILRGWVNYFRIGNSARCFGYIKDWA